MSRNRCSTDRAPWLWDLGRAILNLRLRIGLNQIGAPRSTGRKSPIRRCESPSVRSCRLAAGEHFGDSEFAIGAVWNHRLTRLKMKLLAIELHGDNIGLE